MNKNNTTKGPTLANVCACGEPVVVSVTDVKLRMEKDRVVTFTECVECGREVTFDCFPVISDIAE